ncbi:hypothetical protein AB6A40_006922 [Gnathostoma spinigerum]|uniref:Dehydrogenase E1 component domain-containing protein n=1 Tax=Gnathostoma spinigerum TaxID=75299 RepID=A0ABD6EJR5_9BILA
MDVLAVRSAVDYGRKYCIAGKGPLIIELDTYRYGGHSMSDPGTSYRTREEIKDVRDHRDPINTFKDKILTANLVSEAEVTKIEKEVKAEVEEALRQVDKAPGADKESVCMDIYHNTPPFCVRNTTADSSIVQPFTTTTEMLRATGQPGK